jgi:glycosyltransferase involved in cell wall biosynthesis
MRIVTYLPVLEAVGGVELHTLEVSRELAARGHKIDLFYERDGNLTDEFCSFCETISQGPSPLYSDSPLTDLPRIVPRVFAARGRHPDLIYSNNVSELAWAGGVSTLTRSPIVCQFHEFRPVRRVTLSVLGARVHRFVVASQFMRAEWSQGGIDPDRIDVIPVGLASETYPEASDEDRRRSRELLGLPQDAYVVLYMGRLIPEKGLEVLLDAWTRLGLPPDAARLLIVGVPAEPDEYVQKLQADAPAGCEWIAMRRDVEGVLQAADVLVLPSMWDEPFGRVILEAMATGRPAVASAVGGIPEILDGEFTRMLFPRGDAPALADCLRTLINWRRDDPGLGSRCADHVARRFTLDATATRLEELFADATSGHTASRA